MEKKNTSLLIKLILITTSVGFSLILGELALRVIGYPQPFILTPDVHKTYNIKPYGEFVYRGYLYGIFSDFANPVRLNSLGFHDIEHSVDRKNPDVFRIMVIGDSYVAALSCPLETTFFRRLEHRFNQEKPLGKREYEVIAFGRGNQGQREEINYVQRFAPLYKPNVVVLLFFCGNDIMENYDKTFLLARNFVDKYKRDIATRKISLFRKILIIPNSRLNGLFAESITTFYANHIHWFHHNISFSDTVSPEIGVYQVPLQPIWEKAYDNTSILLNNLKHECLNNDVPLIIAALSGPQAIGDTASEIIKNPSQKKINPQYPLQWIEKWCIDNDVAFVSLQSAILHTDKKKVYWRHDGHLTPYGNDIIVEPLYNRLIKLFF